MRFHATWLLCSMSLGCAREVIPSNAVDASTDAPPMSDTGTGFDASGARPGTLYQLCGANGSTIDLLVISLTAPSGTTVMCPDQNHDIPAGSLQFVIDPPAAGVGTISTSVGGYFHTCMEAPVCAERAEGTITFDHFDPSATTARGSYRMSVVTGEQFSGTFVVVQCHEALTCH